MNKQALFVKILVVWCVFVYLVTLHCKIHKIEQDSKGVVVITAEDLKHWSAYLVGQKSIDLLAPEGAQLVNDKDTPGARHYYGTNEAGKKGWHPLEGEEK